MLEREHEIALDLVRKHPGWSDARVAKALEKRGGRASTSSVQRWRETAGLAPFTKNVSTYPPPRVPGVLLACGHLVHPEHVTGQHGHCVYCDQTSATVG